MPRTKGSLKTVTIIFNQRIEPLKKCMKACNKKYRANMDQTVNSRVDSMQEAKQLLDTYKKTKGIKERRIPPGHGCTHR